MGLRHKHRLIADVGGIPDVYVAIDERCAVKTLIGIETKETGAMTEWRGDQLDKIGRAEEVQIASIRRDGTLRKPVTVWVVRHGDDLYIRSVGGRNAHWFRGAQERHEGRIVAGGVQQDVTFADADHDIEDEVDAAYRSKYRQYVGSILNSVLTPEARSATTKLVPRSARS